MVIHVALPHAFFWMCGQLMLQSNGIVLLYNRIKGLIEPFNGYQHSFQVFFNIVFLLKIATSAESAVCVFFCFFVVVFCCFFRVFFSVLLKRPGLEVVKPFHTQLN